MIIATLWLILSPEGRIIRSLRGPLWLSFYLISLKIFSLQKKLLYLTDGRVFWVILKPKNHVFWKFLKIFLIFFWMLRVPLEQFLRHRLWKYQKFLKNKYYPKKLEHFFFSNFFRFFQVCSGGDLVDFLGFSSSGDLEGKEFLKLTGAD